MRCITFFKTMLIILIINIPISIFSQNTYTSWVEQPDLLIVPSICYVSVSSDNKNIVYWDKPQNKFINYFKIYRESTQQTGKWDSIGITRPNQLSIFIDSTSEPLKQSYRYKISSVDKCGNETSLSSSHKTINLSILKGLNNTYSLIWDEYEGFPVNSYRIYRGLTANSLMLIGSTTAGNFNYNDSYSPVGAIYYQIEVLSSTICNVDSLKSSTTYNSARSNIISNITNGINTTTKLSEINVYPNPFNNKTTISFENNDQYFLFSVYDVFGKSVYTENIETKKFDFYKNDLKEGLYIIELKNKNYSLKGKLVIVK